MSTDTAIDYNAMREVAFRTMLRDFIERECPANIRHLPRRVRWEEGKSWTLKLSERGFIAPAWPVEYGGMGLDAAKLLAYHEEFDAAGVGKVAEQGIVMVGPLIMKFGTEEQKKYYLPRILSYEDIWCQGYSEPGSGSDLASLKTKAVLDGDHWVVNGQKIWTSGATDATNIYMLVRTENTGKKQEGISFLVARTDAPGIDIRPITTLAGHPEFCEVFLTDVRIPRENIVGEVNQGWSIAKALLGFERFTLGSPKLAQAALNRLEAFGRKSGAFQNPSFRDVFSRLHLDVKDLSSAYERFADILKRGGMIGPEISILKIFSTQTQQNIEEYMFESAGEAAMVQGGRVYRDELIDVLGGYFSSRPSTIYGGSTEIQKNIVAKNVLDLPS